MFPRVEICTDGIVQNFLAIRDMAASHEVRLNVVTKALAGYRPLIDVLVEAGADSIGEAHLSNLIMTTDPVEKWMIRSPLPSQVASVVRYADVSLNTEVSTIRSLGEAAVAQGKVHKVIVMAESGDRREGVLLGDLAEVCEETARTLGVELYGIGTEFGCVSDIVPSREPMEEFAASVQNVEDQLGIELPVVSGGSSNSLLMLQEGTLPSRVNNLRVGESILTGRVANYRTPIPGAYLDPFTLSAEIIEIKEKPSQPVGPRAPGEIPVDSDPLFPDVGVRRRALVAVGKQDVGIPHLTPHDPGIQICEGSSDVFVADITDCATPYQTGDILTFSMDYFAILPAMVSSFVEKKLV